MHLPEAEGRRGHCLHSPAQRGPTLPVMTRRSRTVACTSASGGAQGSLICCLNRGRAALTDSPDYTGGLRSQRRQRRLQMALTRPLATPWFPQDPSASTTRYTPSLVPSCPAMLLSHGGGARCYRHTQEESYVAAAASATHIPPLLRCLWWSCPGSLCSLGFTPLSSSLRMRS